MCDELIKYIQIDELRYWWSWLKTSYILQYWEIDSSIIFLVDIGKMNECQILKNIMIIKIQNNNLIEPNVEAMSSAETLILTTEL